jgi:hypothetical protein
MRSPVELSPLRASFQKKIGDVEVMAKHLPLHLMMEAANAVNQHGGSLTRAARQLGLKRSCLRRRVDTAVLAGICVRTVRPRKPRAPRPERLDRLPSDPTPQEIAAECAAIRKSWGRQMERSRRLGGGAVRWSIPVPGDWRGAVEEACA